MTVTINGTGTGVFTDASGNFSVRTATPTAPVTVGRVDSSNEGGQIDLCRASDNASSWAIDVYGNTSTPSLRLVDNVAAAARMVIDGSGNVGIGTSSPGYKLDVSGNARFTTGIVIPNNNWVNCTNTSGAVRDSFGYFTDNNLYITAWDGALILRAASGAAVERARIDTSGYFMVGTTDYRTGIGDLVQTNGSVMSPGGWVAATRTDENAMYLTRKNSDGRIASFYRNSTGVGGISVTTTSTSFNTSSDYRLKYDIQSMTSGLATVSALKPVTYKWNLNDTYGEGFIAHELQEVIPLAVEGEKDAVDANGKLQPQSVDYSKIVVHLVAAIQEQQAQIEELKAKVAALEAK